MSFWSGIRLRLVMLALVLIVPMLGLQIWRTATDRADAIANARLDVAELARSAASQHVTGIEAAASLLRVLRHVPVIRAADPVACHMLLAAVAGEQPQIDTISLRNRDGDAICSSGERLQKPPSVADRPWFREALSPGADGRSFTEIIVKRTTGEAIAAVGSPVSLDDPAGTRPGPDGSNAVLLVTLRLRWLSDIALQHQTSGAAIVTITDLQGGATLAQAPPPRDIAGRSMPPSPLLEAFHAKFSGVMDTQGPDGLIRIVGFQRLAGDADRQAVVSVAIDQALVLAGANRRVLVEVGMTMLMLSLGLAIAWVVAKRSITDPLQALGRAAQRLGAGDLSVRAPLAGLRLTEFQRLGQMFNKAVEQIERRDQQLEILAWQDGLTGLANRRLFDMTLAREWLRAQRTGQPLALMLLDVDHFKRFNDCYGHQAGDDCLRSVSVSISASVREGSDLVARYGGEEIAVILPETDLPGAKRLADRMVEQVQNMAITHEHSDFGVVTVSAGVMALLPTSEGSSPRTLIQAADEALYSAKRAGRCRAACHGSLVLVEPVVTA